MFPRRFFETEGIAILTMLVARYRIEIKDEPQFAGETAEERRERVLSARSGLTLTCVPVLRFCLLLSVWRADLVAVAGPRACRWFSRGETEYAADLCPDRPI